MQGVCPRGFHRSLTNRTAFGGRKKGGGGGIWFDSSKSGVDSQQGALLVLMASCQRGQHSMESRKEKAAARQLETSNRGVVLAARTLRGCKANQGCSLQK